MNYTFNDTLQFFGQKLGSLPPKEDVEAGDVELIVDGVRISLKKGHFSGGLQIKIDLGFFLIRAQKKHIQELAKANFLGVDTGGCTFSFDETGVTLQLKTATSPATTLQESWEWLHRILSVYHHWNLELSQWKEFTPLTAEKGAQRNNPSTRRHPLS
ncbi:MAG: hypothetical protein H7A36_04735 [Chlamydiales bacterium]|nr:hypothetical protein [Chlamydiales bacterium]